jgi:hypothetical protein
LNASGDAYRFKTSSEIRGRATCRSSTGAGFERDTKGACLVNTFL